MSRQTEDFEKFEELLSGASGFDDQELARLGALARALEANGPVTAGPNPAFRDTLRTRLLGEAPAGVVVRLPLGTRIRSSVAERNTRMRRRMRTMVAMGAAAAMLLTGGSVFAASQRAVPGDRLYGIEQFGEDVALKLTFGAKDKATRQLDYARERLDEITILTERRVVRASPFVIALEDMDELVRAASRALLSEFRKTKDPSLLEPLIGFARAQRASLESVEAALPPAARPAARSSMDLLILVQDRAAGVLGGCPCPVDVLIPPAQVPPGTPGGVDCACKAKIPAVTKPSVTKPSVTKPSVPASPPAVTAPKTVTPPKTDTGILPDVDGTNLDEKVEEIVEPFLETLGISTSSSPLAIPSLSL